MCQTYPIYCSVLQAPTFYFTLGLEQSPSPAATDLEEEAANADSCCIQVLGNSQGRARNMIFSGTGSAATNHPSSLKKTQEGNFAFIVMGPVDVKYSFLTDLFETFYFHA